MNALEVRELTKVYPEFTLDKVSFFVKQGHISGLIGRNGAGKSTTIKGILRLINAEGSVSVFGKDFLEEEMAVKQTIGYVGGGFRYYPMNTLAAIRKAYAPFYPTWNQSKYEKFLSQFELIENKKVKELSEGMKVKFALALALKILAACPLKELLCKYKLAHFSSLADASAVNAIGVKAVKEGYEGLLPRNMQISESIAVTDATIDNIIVHLEKENEDFVCTLRLLSFSFLPCLFLCRITRMKSFSFSHAFRYFSAV